MMSLPNCPQCNSEYVYEDGLMLVCHSNWRKVVSQCGFDLNFPDG